MVKITFKDLPDTTTPLNASNLNTMQDNIEDAIDNIEITLDDAVSTSSTNGVENQAITNYVDGKISNSSGISQTEGYSQEYINSIIPTATSDLTNDSFKFRLYSSSATVPANGEISINLGSPNAPSGYEYLGCIPCQSGYGDQWVVSYGLYQDNIYAKIISTWGASLTSTISCYVVYIKSSIKNQMIL